MVMQLVKDNRKIVDRITHKHIDTYIDLLRQNKVRYIYIYHANILTISILQPCCAVTTEYGIPTEFVRTSTGALQIKISAAQHIFSNRNVIYILKVE